MQDSHQKQTTYIYNANAQKYKDGSKDFSFPSNMFETFISHLKNDSKILDIWYAYGRDIQRLRKLWFEAHWLEISENLIELADEDIKNFIQKWDMTKISQIYSPESFSSVMCVASIVHMDHTVWISVLQQSYNLIKTGGILYLSLKVADKEKTEFKESISTPGCQKKYTYYGKNKIESDLEDIWFQILKTHSWTPKNDTWKILICKK